MTARPHPEEPAEALAEAGVSKDRLRPHPELAATKLARHPADSINHRRSKLALIPRRPRSGRLEGRGRARGVLGHPSRLPRLKRPGSHLRMRWEFGCENFHPRRVDRTGGLLRMRAAGEMLRPAHPRPA